MRIVIDMQGAQTKSPHCGIGRYTLLLAQAIARNRDEHEIILALSGLLPEPIDSIRAAFDGLLPQENIRVWYAPGPVRGCETANKWRREVAELIREAFLASLRPDVIFIAGFFEGYHDESVASIGLFTQNLVTVVALDGLNSKRDEVASPGESIHALRKIEHLKRANLLVALPPLTVDAVCQSLEVSPGRVKASLMIGEALTNLQEAGAVVKNLIKKFEELTAVHPLSLRLPLNLRPKLAYVSPLPPERSGIADYSAELLPGLGRYFDIDVIVDQAEVSTPWITANCSIRTVEWFLENSHRYGRVLYHFGNSPYHQHMFDLLTQVPGVVVLHDFYLGDVQSYRELHAGSPNAWTKELYESHGFGAAAKRFLGNNDVDLIGKYPVNLTVLQQAQGVIVHSNYAQQLATDWYGKDFAADWQVIPLLRKSGIHVDRAQARAVLGLKDDDFVVCSFGLLGPAKLNHRLLAAWLQSRLAQDARCMLVFVGENDGYEYGVQFKETICASGLETHIRITGWVDMPTFRNYLAAADIAVQLRTFSRGETSAAVLDCMNYALPTLVNANGSMADLPADGVWMLPDAFEDIQLVEGLETLWKDGERRAVLGKRAQEFILTRHAPRACAKQYAETIEKFHARALDSIHALVGAIAKLDGDLPSDADCLALAQPISQSLPTTKSTRQLLVDVSSTCRNDLKTGIQRVVRALIWELIQAPPPGYRIEPVYMTDQGGYWHYRYARSWTSKALNVPGEWASDEITEFYAGDLMLVADFTNGYVTEGQRTGLLQNIRNEGVELHFVIYDLLPIQMPEVFPPGVSGAHADWLNAVCLVADSAICISQAVAEDFRSRVSSSGKRRLHPLRVEWFHLGANLKNSIPSRGMPENSEQVLCTLRESSSFLMVGTVEPRKGHAQAISAFELLWSKGFNINLMIVGKQGWMSEVLSERLRSHAEFSQRLFWLESDISDEYLEKIYAASTCLIAASEGEGFGLPLIEAAYHRLPIIARGISVFREVAGDHAFYFEGKAPEDLALAISDWSGLYAVEQHPASENMPRLTWKESADRLVEVVLGGSKPVKNELSTAMK